MLDGGIRRGGDVVEALALGAKAALLGLGKASIADLTPDDLVVPPGFILTLGGDSPIFGP